MSSPTTGRFVSTRSPSERPGPAGGARAVNRDNRISALCEGALELFLAKGVEAVTVDEVARAADMSKAAFYRYFRSNGELVSAVFQPVEAAIGPVLHTAEHQLDAATSPEDLVMAYAGLTAGLLPVVLFHARGIRLYLQERLGPRTASRAPIHALADRIQAHILTMTHASRRHGLLRDVDVRVTTILVSGAVHELLSRALAAEDGDPVLDSAILVDLMLGGLRR